MTAREYALDWLRSHRDAGRTLDDILHSHEGGGGPQCGDNPAYHYQINGAYLFRHTGASIKLKAGQIGVDLAWDDRRQDTGVFSIRELWREIAHPMPKQLSLFDEVQP